MAINDIKISNLPSIDTNNILDTGLILHTQDNGNYTFTISQLRELTKYKIASEPILDPVGLVDDSPFVTETTDGQGAITYKHLYTEIMNKIIPLIPVVPKVQRASMRLSTAVTQTITDDIVPVKAEAFDTAVTQTQYLSVGTTNDNITYTGHTEIDSAIVSIGLNMGFPGTEEVEVYLYINNQPYSTQPIHAQGRGAGKPVEVYWSSDISLSPNDVLDIRIRNADSGSFDLTYLRSTFRVDITPNLDT